MLCLLFILTPLYFPKYNQNITLLYVQISQVKLGKGNRQSGSMFVMMAKCILLLPQVTWLVELEQEML